MSGGELTDPVSYSGWWTVVAVVLPVLVVAWYAGVAWLTRDRTVSHVPTRLRHWQARRSHLRELARIERARAHGELSTRQAHQAISVTVRSFVTEVGPVDARTMNLEQLQASGTPAAGVVALVYPPAFEPHEDTAEERFGSALSEARDLVASWRG